LETNMLKPKKQELKKKGQYMGNRIYPE
jgi:hypothetical protein